MSTIRGEVQLEVNLSQNNLGPAAAVALGESPHLRSLLVLRLEDNPSLVSAAAALAASPLGRRLAILEVDDPLPPPGSPADDAIPF